MLWLARQIFNPLIYLRIRQGSGPFASKSTVDWVVPIFLGVITLIVVYALPGRINLLGPDGLITRFLDLLELLAAFFIAALAAVATFERAGLDEPMKGSSPATLRRYRKSAQGNVEGPLTRRQYICYLFGYLSFISLLFFILINFARVAAPGLAVWLYGH